MPKVRANPFDIPPLPLSLVKRFGSDFTFSPLLRRKLCTVVAPAGYSKTTSVAFFASLNPDILFRWLPLQPADADIHRFISRLAQCLGSAYPNLGKAISLALDAEPPESLAISERAKAFGEQVSRLVDDLVIDDLVLVVDDYHAVHHEPLINEFITGLLHAMPECLHLVVLSREEVNFDTAMIFAQQQHLAVKRDEICFTEDEIKSLLLHQFDADKIEEGTVTQLRTLTEGWAAGLIMMIEELRKRRRAKPIDIAESLAASRETIRGYLSGQLFQRLSSDIQTFLMATSAAEGFDKPLASLLLDAFCLAPKEKRNPATGSLKTTTTKTGNVKAMRAGTTRLERRATPADIERLTRILISKNLLIVSSPSDGDPVLRYQYPNFLREFLLTLLPEPVRPSLYAVCANYFLRADSFHNAADYFLLAGHGPEALVCLEHLIEDDSEVSPASLRHSLRRVEQLGVPPEALPVLRYLQAKVEHHLGNLTASESFVRRHESEQAALAAATTETAKAIATAVSARAATKHSRTDAKQQAKRLYRIRLIHLENLLVQSKFKALYDEGNTLLAELKKKKNTAEEVRIRALSLVAFSLSKLEPAFSGLERAMKMLDDAWTACRTTANIKVESDVLKLRYLVSQQVSYQKAMDAYKDWERLFSCLSLRQRIDAIRDHAFLLTLTGNYAEARPKILEVSALSDRYAYAHGFYTAKFLFAECLAAEGQFEKAIRRYDETAEHYQSISPENAVMILYHNTLCHFHYGEPAAVEQIAEKCRKMFFALEKPAVRSQVQYHVTLFFAALAAQNFAKAEEYLAISKRLVEEREDNKDSLPEILLFESYFHLVSPTSTINGFLESAARYLVELEPKPTDFPYLSLKRHWRLAEAVLHRLLALKSAPPSAQTDSLKSQLARISLADIQRLLRLLVEHKRSLGIIESEGSLSSASGQHILPSVQPVRISTLGEFKLSRDGRPAAQITDASFHRRSIKQVLMVLLINHKQPVSGETFYEGVFARAARENHPHMLRTYVSAVRRLFVETGICEPETDVIIKTEAGYRLHFGTRGIDYIYDAEAFEERLSLARASTEPKDAFEHYTAALSLYKGEYLTDARFEEWSAHRRGVLEEGYLEAVMFLARWHFSEKRFTVAADLCEQALAVHAVFTPAYELLIHTCLERQLYAEAQSVFQRCRKAFRDTLDTYPPLSLERLATGELARPAASPLR